MHSRLVTTLRSRGVTVLTVMDAGLTEKTDGEQLAFATESECVLYVSDFYQLHTQWISAGREHAGIILAPQQRICGTGSSSSAIGLMIGMKRISRRVRCGSWLTSLFAVAPQVENGSPETLRNFEKRSCKTVFL